MNKEQLLKTAKGILLNTEMVQAILDGRKGKIFRRKGDTGTDNDFLMARLTRGSEKSEVNGCINWIKATNGIGYGTLKIKGKTEYAHRLSYSLHNGEIDSDIKVCHKCDNPSCVNPYHLFLGTQSDNMKDCYDKGRSKIKPHSMSGAENPNAKLTEEEVIKIKSLIENGDTEQSIASKFNVSQGLINSIKKGKLWKD